MLMGTRNSYTECSGRVLCYAILNKNIALLDKNKFLKYCDLSTCTKFAMVSKCIQ